jgi:hypothetical protein
MDPACEVCLPKSLCDYEPANGFGSALQLFADPVIQKRVRKFTLDRAEICSSLLFRELYNQLMAARPRNVYVTLSSKLVARSKNNALGIKR